MAIARADWTEVFSAAELATRGKAVVKPGGRQILLWRSGDAIYACNNRCPHEGYPLAEGTLADGCVLTCNWHNWKFDLASGETIVGGDALRRYPVKTDGDAILLDLADPPAVEVRARALAGLEEALADHDYERMAREMARFEATGADLPDALDAAFGWAADRYEFGMTHAQAAARDWLALRASLPIDAAADRLVPVLEIIGHLSWDARGERDRFPFAGGRADVFDGAALEDAIEREDEAIAVGLVRAAIEDRELVPLRRSLERVALRHYQGFGHPPIYVEKTFALLAVLGPVATEALLFPLVRNFCMGAREDLIPEFRAYAPALQSWDPSGTDVPDPSAVRGAGVSQCLDLIAAGGGQVGNLYDTVLFAAADAMLHYDARFRAHVDKPVQQNVDWLDFTHAITHLNSARKICARQPDLWSNALLQSGCFLGRNAAFVDWDQDVAQWTVDDPGEFFDAIFDGLLDHGEPLYIYSAHTLKLATAIREEVDRDPGAAWVPVLLAALNRFVHEPPKKKHARRVAHQALSFVRAQG
ncbi:MAG: Rieske (2Fe-2S) protein [Alphaproteobacteria bacterium]|nr:Rieske (2Fe-2S) protein [Alphaproteobacteria bacterium]